MSSSSEIIPCSVCVVGGGLAGLIAARTITKQDPSQQVIVLEAAQTVGGRARGAWFVRDLQNNIRELLDECGIPALPVVRDPCLLDGWIGSGASSRPRWCRAGLWASPTSAPWHWLGFIEAKLVVRRLDALSKRIDPGQPYKNYGLAAMLDDCTVASYIREECYFSEARERLEALMLKLFGVSAGAVSLLYLLTYAASVGGFQAIYCKTNSAGKVEGGQELMIPGGAQALCEKLAKMIGPKQILCNQPVQSIVEMNGKVFVTTRTNQYFQCERVILAVPPNLLASMDIQPALPSLKRYALNNMTSGAVTTFLARYDKEFWVNKGLSGRLVCLGGKKACKYCEGQPYGLITPVEVKGKPALLGSLAGNRCLQWLKIDADGFKHFLMESLSEVFGHCAQSECRGLEIISWTDELSYVGGVPTCTPRPGTMLGFHALREQHGKLHFAGSETATRWISHLSGAVQSGHRAALEVLRELRPQTLSPLDHVVLNDSRRPELPISEANTLNLPKKRGVYRWTLFLPVFGIGMSYLALRFRDVFSQLLIPSHI